MSSYLRYVIYRCIFDKSDYINRPCVLMLDNQDRNKIKAPTLVRIKYDINYAMTFKPFGSISGPKAISPKISLNIYIKTYGYLEIIVRPSNGEKIINANDYL